MTSRTFALSRQRRRRTNAQPPLVPAQDVALAQPGSANELGDEQEREPSMQRDDAGRPVDPATHSAGARPPAPRLPHEHDQYADQPGAPRAPIVQAERDLADGQVDTDLRGQAAQNFERAPRRRPNR